jgi:hypothetical protein
MKKENERKLISVADYKVVELIRVQMDQLV